ncbi:MAG: hypothetical protein AAB778_03885 [Patescibacteria group bacterium]
MKILKYLFLSFVILFYSTNHVQAKAPEEYNLTGQKTLPSSPSYSFKRIKEKGLMAIKISSKSKYKYSVILLEKRLSELISLVDVKDPNLIPGSSQRFSYQAGILADINSKLKESKKEDIKIKFENYKKILSELRDNYPANSAHWLLIQQNIDTLNILFDKIK